MLCPCLSCAFFSLVCITGTSEEEVTGAVAVEVAGRGHSVSEFNFAYQVPDCSANPQLPAGLSLCGCPSPFGFAFIERPSLRLPCLSEASWPLFWPDFVYLSPHPTQDPKVHSIFPGHGPRAGGTRLTLHGSKLLTGRLEDIRVVIGDQPCHL